MLRKKKKAKAAHRHDPVVEHLAGAVHSLLQTVAALSDDVANLNLTVKVLDKVIGALTRPLLTQHLALRDLLIAKGVVTADEAHAAAQLAELDAMLDRSEERRTLDG